MISRKGILKRSCPAGKLSHNREMTSIGRLETTWLLRKENTPQCGTAVPGSREPAARGVPQAGGTVTHGAELAQANEGGEKSPSGCAGLNEVTGELHRGGCCLRERMISGIMEGTGVYKGRTRACAAWPSHTNTTKTSHSKRQ